MLINGMRWYDTDNNEIHAHGGCMLEYGEYCYWYGENRTDNNFVSCYRTKDFKTWEFCNHILTSESFAQKINERNDLSLKRKEEDFDPAVPKLGLLRYDNQKNIIANIERPKVVYNPKTGKFVMWMHYENGHDYDDARCAIATCDTPDGDFVYHGSFRPMGNESRDCTLYEFKDKMYFVAASNANLDLIAYELTEDYLDITDNKYVIFPGKKREAPAFFTKDGEVFVLTSGCTGWRPNQCMFSKSSNLSEWQELQNIGDSVTYYSQPAFVFHCKKTNKYYYIGDRWGNSSAEYFTSTYVVFEISFDNENIPQLVYCENAKLAE